MTDCARIPAVARTLCVISALAFAAPSWAQSSLTAPPEGNDWVAVTVTNRAVVMATRALPRYGQRLLFRGKSYRVRLVPLPPQPRVSKVQLSTDGTVLSIDFEGGRTSLVDLTQQVLEVKVGQQMPTPFHVLTPMAQVVDAELTKFANSELEQRFFVEQELRDGAQWDVYRPTPADELRYAPVLQELPEEQVWPSAFEIWSDILQQAPTAKTWPKAAARTWNNKASEPARNELLRAYNLIENRSCNIYWRRLPFDGSWLLEYWLYYPFDYGLNGHLHDSEHLFIEVDRLGGTVRRVAGAGHGQWAANSIYHTFANDAVPVARRVHALVELGKHATAPDINGDGVFTPGIDSNIYRDTAKVWGVRDTTGLTDSSLRAFDGTMAAPRDRDDRRRKLMPAREAVPANRTSLNVTCGLIELPAKPATTDAKICETDPLSAACARHHVENHGDYKNENGILKPAAFPRQYLRANFLDRVGRTSADGGSWGIGVGFGIELQSLWPISRLLPLPGRVYGQVTPGRYAGADGSRAWRVKHFSVSYEVLKTNLGGIYFGLANERRPIPTADGGRWATAAATGMLLEIPLPLKWVDGLGSGLNFQTRAGINTDGKTGIGADIQVGFGISFGAPFRKFGIRSGDPNPY